MVQQLGFLKETPSQTAGPYVHIGCTPNFSGITGVYEADLGVAMVNDKTLGERITIRGRVFDGTGTPLRDALLEIWQADSNGLYNSPSELRGTADPNFTGWGRCPTDMETGEFVFETVKPGTGSVQGWASDGAPYQRLDRCSRHQYRVADADLFRRSESGQ